MARSWPRGRWTICGGSTVPATPAWRSCSLSSREAPRCASWRRCWATRGAAAVHEQVVVVAGARAEVADRSAAGARGALAGRLGQAGAARRRGHGVLARRVLGSLPGAAAPPRGPRPRPPAGRESARGGALVLRRHPRAIERHHRALELLPGEGPRPARLGSGRLAAALLGQARRDAAALVVDGGAHGGAHTHRVWRDLSRRLAVRALRHPHAGADAGAPRRRGLGSHPGARQRVPGTPHPRPALDRRPGSRRWTDPATARVLTGAARPSLNGPVLTLTSIGDRHALTTDPL